MEEPVMTEYELSLALGAFAREWHAADKAYDAGDSTEEPPAWASITDVTPEKWAEEVARAAFKAKREGKAVPAPEQEKAEPAKGQDGA